MHLLTGNFRLIGWSVNVKNSVFGVQFDPRWDSYLVNEPGCYLYTIQIYMGNAKKRGLPRTSTCRVRLKPECWKCSQEPSSRYLQKPDEVSRSRIGFSRYQSTLENGFGSILPLGSRVNWGFGSLGLQVSFWFGNLVHEELVSKNFAPQFRNGINSCSAEISDICNLTSKKVLKAAEI